MATFKIFRETTLPGTPQNDALYVVAPAGTPDYIELYAVNSAGAIRRIPTSVDIDAMITTALASVNELTIVANIAARNALAPTKVMHVFVTDATGDATVASGGATYMFNPVGSVWIKISEAESLDVVLNWSAIVGKPSSSPAAIDSAVANAHTHSNKTQLDLIGESSGQMTYNGAVVKTQWDSTNW